MFDGGFRLFDLETEIFYRLSTALPLNLKTLFQFFLLMSNNRQMILHVVDLGGALVFEIS